MTTTTIPAVTADDHHVTVPTTPPKLIVKQHDASSSFNVTDNTRVLRDLTRARALTVRDRTRQIQRLEKFLESSGIKLSSVVSNLLGVSSRMMLDALVAGERDPQVLSALAQGRLKAKIPELIEALNGRFSDHHAMMVRAHLKQIDTFTECIDAFTLEIEAAMEPFQAARDALETIPGISTRIAEVIIAETGGDMSVFPTAGHLASWAGVCPGSNESAGRVKSSHILPGNKHLKAALGTAAMAAAHSKTSYLAVKYRRIAARRGPMKAVVALEHTILTAVWNMLTTGEIYQDLGLDHYTSLNPDRLKNRALKQLHNLGYEVTITHAAA
ncbi:IS110 family transposase [Cryobacterium psychrophilum]|uniref:IS110 family transposase n=1 Tax=Cryobacterium psychrophilum TaxID=41988 RepID=UPI0010D07561|nr:IS110 family transposase [Cryobacterium psychrophilum]TDW26916.1 transposase IS116/IS110/IS902 family protein [Cryobacterium psychrophilum]